MPTANPMTGELIGNYEIAELLGRGGMGSVYKGRHVTLERNVAIKFLSPQLSHSADYVTRFLREARAAAHLNHPNIIGVYDAGAVDDVYYFVMEYIDGQDLGKILKNGKPFSEEEALGQGIKAAHALAYAHQHGIIHRDVKPENLILGGNGELKVADLGLAKQIDQQDQTLTLSGTVMGSPYYISPEQIRGSKDVDARTDIYSLGASLFHMVTGKVPYSGSSAAEIMSNHLTVPLPWPQSINPALSKGFCRVLYKMMAKERKERFQSMEEVVKILEMVRAGQAPEFSTTLPLFESGMARSASEGDSASQGDPIPRPIATTHVSAVPFTSSPTAPTTLDEPRTGRPAPVPFSLPLTTDPCPGDATSAEPSDENSSWLSRILAQPGPAQLPWGIWARIGIGGGLLLAVIIFWMVNSSAKNGKGQSTKSGASQAGATNQVVQTEENPKKKSANKTRRSSSETKNEDDNGDKTDFSRYSTKRNLQ